MRAIRATAPGMAPSSTASFNMASIRANRWADIPEASGLPEVSIAVDEEVGVWAESPVPQTRNSKRILNRIKGWFLVGRIKYTQSETIYKRI